ncbi:hypothetical protein XELAEV_18030852mg [Xenopus laevis]|uniref:Uncharacterized protein n=1 Tax=Xenopus laevis TaxID=8355 RepID=A0A974CM05_XENLA|nr:hypothetical protein XELAEV_18030852mg [Xenopus laevis]
MVLLSCNSTRCLLFLLHLKQHELCFNCSYTYTYTGLYLGISSGLKPILGRNIGFDLFIYQTMCNCSVLISGLIESDFLLSWHV